MGEYLDLPNYTGWELIHEDPRTGVAQHRAHVTNQPHKRVIVKALQFFSEEENQNLKQEYDLLKQVNKYLDENYIKEPVKTVTRRRSSIKVATLPMMIHENREGSSSLFSSNPALPPKQQPLIPNVIALERVYDEGLYAIVTEDFDGVPLRKYYPSLVSNNSLENLMDRSSCSIAVSIDKSKENILAPVDPDLKKLDFEEVLQTMLLLTEAVDICHRAKVAHLNINPDNILIQKSRSKIQLQLTNFDHAVKFEDFNNVTTRQLRAYTYASPEQTGRTDRLMDYRSDMYSLGITLWELLIEDVPFKYSDAAEMIYAHLAKNVQSPTEKFDYIPEQLSAVILKLVKKDPSERYQLASAVRYDLQKCLDRWNDSKVRKGWKTVSPEHIKEAFAEWNFTIGEKDYSQVISFPLRPIGREEQLDQLKSVFDEWHGTISSERRGMFLCLSGQRGCGKRTFWEELCKHAMAQNCFTLEADINDDDFIVPYYAYRSILDQLVKILLAESTVSLQKWEEKLVGHVGLARLNLLSYLVPSLTHIVTKLTKIENSSFISSTKQLELYQAVQYFLDLFATEEHPLLINLNYLNSDPGTVEMTSYLINTPLSKSCLFVGFLDDNEMNSPKSNQMTSAQILEMLSYPKLEHIVFPLLNLEEIQDFLQDILLPCHQSTSQLAMILLRRTGGNYSFLKEFIRFCEKKELIKFDQSALSWTWDEKRIEAEVETTKNAAELMMFQFSELDPKVQSLLRCAACVGHSFDMRLVSHISNAPITQVLNLLNQAVVSGYIIPIQAIQKSGSDIDSTKSASNSQLNSMIITSNSSLSQEVAHAYKFCHILLYKRLSETLDQSEKEKLSLQIARYYKSSSEEKFTEKTRDMLKHYHIAMGLVNNDQELLYIAETNYRASFRATCLNTASNFLNNAMISLSRISQPTPESKETEYQIQYSLANVCIQNDMIQNAESIVKEMQVNCDTAEKYDKLESLCIAILASKKKVKEAIELAMTTKCNIGKYVHRFQFYNKSPQELIQNLDELFGVRSIEDILSKKRSSDTSLDIAEHMLANCTQIFQKKGEAHGASYFNMLACALSLNHGISKSSSETFAMVLPYFLGRLYNYFDFKRAKFIGELVLASSEALNAEGKVNALQGLLKGFTYFWSYYEANERMSQAVKTALEGKMAGKAFDVMITFHTSFSLPYGKPLNVLKEWDKKFKSISEFSEQQNRQWDLMLAGFDSIASGFPVNFDIDSDYNPQLRAFLQCANVLSGLLYQKEDRFDRYEALKSIEDQIHGSWLYVDYLLYGVLLDVERVQLGLSSKEAARKELDHKIQLIQTHVSAQFSIEQKLKLYLANAIREKMEGNISNAIGQFEEAIDAAQIAGNIMYLAWINEMYGTFWMSISSKKVAKPFFTAAMNIWEQWGSEMKASEIASRYPDMIKSSQSNTSSRRNSVRKSKMFSSLKESHGSDSELFGGYEPVKLSGMSKKVVDIDINTVLKVTNSITNETNLDVLVDKILGHLMNNTGASRAVFFLNDGGSLKLQKILNTEGSESFDPANVDLMAPSALLNYIFRTQESKVYSDCPTDSFLVNDPYIEMYKPKSILCCPIKHQNVITGAFYLENRLQNGSFTTNRVNLVKSLMASASISIANAQLLLKNKELSQALQNSTVPSPKYNVETPMQKVFEAINSVKLKFEPDDPIVQTLDVVLSTLMSDGLFSANLGEVNDKDGKGIDQDTKNWIESSLLMTTQAKSESRDKQVRLTPNEKDVLPMITINNSHIKQNEINAILEKSADPSFDCFELNTVSEGQPLYFLTTHMLNKYRLTEAFGLNPVTVQAFLQKVESSYNKLPYHNSIHATDVLQSVELLLFSSEYAKSFTQMEFFSLIIASAIHDLDHPGINNNFLVQLQHPLAIMYNDLAVLESHHVARAFEISKMSGLNIFETMSGEQFRQCRKMIISIVLATDLAQHFQFISKFKGKTSSGSLKLEDDSDRHLVMEMAIKCGDLGNPVKTFTQAKLWTNLVMEEFFRQGDKEKMVGLPVSKFMDRNDTNISKCQIGFIDFLVTPLYDAWATFSKTEYTTYCLQNIANNRTQWQANAENPNVLDGVPASEFEKLDNLLDVTIPSISFGSRNVNRRSSLPRRFTYTSQGPPEMDLKKITEQDQPIVNTQESVTAAVKQVKT